MKWKAIKEVLVAFFIIFTFEAIGHWTGFPLTVFDILLFPLSSFLLVYGLVLFFRGGNREDLKNANELTFLQVIGSLIISIFLFLLGVFLAISGFQEPLILSTSVKGNMHGYTVFSLGLLIVGLGLYLAYVLVAKFSKKA